MENWKFWRTDQPLFRDRSSWRTDPAVSYSQIVFLSGVDLGYLLLTNPVRVHSFELPFGKAHVFYPRLSERRSAATLLLDIDPVELVRGRGQAASGGRSISMSMTGPMWRLHF
jgi:hypothetical protein